LERFDRRVLICRVDCEALGFERGFRLESHRVVFFEFGGKEGFPVMNFFGIAGEVA
jgi:hypothetical protein